MENIVQITVDGDYRVHVFSRPCVRNLFALKRTSIFTLALSAAIKNIATTRRDDLMFPVGGLGLMESAPYEILSRKNNKFLTRLCFLLEVRSKLLLCGLPRCSALISIENLLNFDQTSVAFLHRQRDGSIVLRHTSATQHKRD